MGVMNAVSVIRRSRRRIDLRSARAPAAAPPLGRAGRCRRHRRGERARSSGGPPPSRQARQAPMQRHEGAITSALMRSTARASSLPSPAPCRAQHQPGNRSSRGFAAPVHGAVIPDHPRHHEHLIRAAVASIAEKACSTGRRRSSGSSAADKGQDPGVEGAGGDMIITAGVQHTPTEETWSISSSPKTDHRAHPPWSWCASRSGRQCRLGATARPRQREGRDRPPLMDAMRRELNKLRSTARW